MDVAGNAEYRRVVLTREIVAGLAGMVVACFAAVVLSPEGDPRERVVVLALACGLLTAVLTDWRAAIVIVAVSVVLFVGVLADGVPVSADAWGLTPVFPVAALVGMGNRRLRSTSRDGDR